MSAAIYPSAPSTSSITPIAPAFVNPAQMQNAQAGPSSPPSNKKKPPQPAKRKRTDTPEDDTAESATSPRKARDGPKKKKANRACFHCQKAHLTCDDSRPCQRCIKRGIANNCTEGHRKKAKYLLDDDELEQLKRKSTSTSASASEPPPAPPASSLSADPFPQNDPLLSNSFDPNFAFDSEVAGLEYSILSAILGNPSPPDSETSPPPQHQPYTSWSSDVDFTTSPKLSSYASSYSDTQLSSLPLKSTSSGGAPYLAYGYTQQRSEDIELQYQSQYSSDQPPESPHPLQPRFPLDSRARSPPGDAYIPGKDTVTTNTGLLSPAPSNASPTTTTSVPLAVADLSVPSRSKLQSINDRVTQPYDYTEGYHFLMKHLPNRFEKDDILRIVRALAIFRPSLIALQMPLSRDDEIFVEKCFQRTLLVRILFGCVLISDA
ncbi:hypothetical protein AX14_007176 [Amanita brunnescens Koide BX004]|nr:hypothetical protein AX14_007176 [Amanita brunnescens Koide BX004]